MGSVAFLLVQAGHLWFFGDDWDFLVLRGVTGHPRQSIWAPHNEHWSTLPILLFRALFSLVGVRHYLPYASAVLVLHALVVILLWSLMRRAGVRPWVAASFGGVVALMGAGAENTLWDFQVGFVAAVMFGLLAVRLMPSGASIRRRDLGVVAAVVAGLMCSGQGLTMLVVVVSFALLTRGWRPAAAHATSGILPFLVWYGAIGHRGMSGGLDSPLLLPEFVWTGLGHVWQAMTGLPGLGVLVLAAPLLMLVRPGVDRSQAGLAAAGVAGALCLFSLAALTRANLGVAESETSRYAYVAAVLTAPLLAVAVQAALGPRPRHDLLSTSICLAVVLLVALEGLHSVVEWRKWRAGILAGTRERVVGAAVVGASGEPLLRLLPSPQFDPNLGVADVVSLARRGDLPHLGSNASGVLDARSRLQVNVLSGLLSLPVATELTAQGVELRHGSPAAGCVSGETHGDNAAVTIHVGAGGVRTVLRSSGTQVVTVLAGGSLRSSGEGWATVPYAPYTVGSTATGDDLLVVFPHPVSFSLCPV